MSRAGPTSQSGPAARRGAGAQRKSTTPAQEHDPARYVAWEVMAGSEPLLGTSSSPPPPSDWGRLEAAILSGWRTFWQSVGKERTVRTASREEADEDTSTLTQLPVSLGCGGRPSLTLRASAVPPLQPCQAV